MGTHGESDPEVKAVLNVLQTDPDEALQKALEVIRAAQGRGDKALEVRARVALCAVKLQQGDARGALEEARVALAAAPESSPELRCQALRSVVAASLQDGALDVAMREVTAALQQFQGRNDLCGEANALELQAEVSAAREDYDVALETAARARGIFEKLGAQERDQWAGYSLLKLAEFYISAWKPLDALKVSEEALAIFRAKGDKPGEGAALQTVANSHLLEQNGDAALAKVEEALSIFKSLDDRAAQTAALRTKINALLVTKKHTEARSASGEAAAIFKAAGDAKGEASALLLVTEVCLQTLHSREALTAAREALELFKGAGSRAGQAAALTAITAAAYDDESGQAVEAAQEKVALFKDSGEWYQEADSLLALANVLVSRIGKKIARCKLASSDDTLAALRAAKDAHLKFSTSGNPAGMESAMRVVSQILLYNNVSSDVIDAVRDPEEVLQDVMSGKYSDPRNALPKPDVVKSTKLDEIIPSSKQLDRNKFAWNQPLNGYSYTMIWQPTKDRQVRNRKPRGSYDILTLASGAKTTSTPALLQARSHDASERNDPLVVYMLSSDCKENYASTIMSVVQTMGAMITARVPRLVFVQFDEPHYDWTDTSARQCNMYPVILGLLRSMRIEAPHVTVGFVGGDAASWISNPSPMIDSIFDTIECDESEVIYKKGDAFAPLLVHRELDEATQFVKPKAKIGWKATK
mmetsp:Transcript_35303/g.101513  ORF Transcript_35303/g.101513 Transcript_35303/m.101513 type:complete len:701 (-) Transcript_35303:173-2275(-)|eukprot:CAMPEP_0177181782 /NCGR_PEP_ID=MMETSP0367-20130122/16116_1 /TAXON_ID=447022 ORGANISM="Scrippsiella hangoei-like, Strain SHHI-4" /NCGR_SAMPLE_ID=MMETSP0367 /ASSEMBLY_ACC=CAM_ASM_000362 /LENGTH=700 /DNA_ID=CAMNT_0018628671 /DNA_START=60 /DNA_END=2162 /DNA_ORIENTATION=+